MRPNVLVLSCLFPNSQQPDYGVFVRSRLQAVGRICNVRVVAPVAQYPLFDGILRGRRNGVAVPLQEHCEALQVHHPRFLVIPRFLKWLDALTYYFAVAPVVKRIEDQDAFDSDLIDVHWTYPDSVAGYWLARRRHKKFLVTVRGREALYPGERSLRRWMLRYCLRRAAAIVTLSDELKALVLELGVPPDRVRTILNGVDPSRFHLQSAADCRRKLGLAMNKTILVSVGSLTRRKGHDALVRMMPVLSAGREVELYILGNPGPEGDTTAELDSLIARLGLSNVHIVGGVGHTTLADWYGAADLFCLATRGEGCPNVVLEALACGVPVVSTDVGAVRHLVTDGVNGFLLPLDRLDQLAEVVAKALGWSWDRQQIAERMGRQGWAQCAEEVIGTYQSVLAARAGA
jgi:glycosyltransferase involved in cell wall biosynthesis